MKFHQNSVLWLLISMLTNESCFVLCQDVVCWFRLVILKSKMYSGVFDLMTPTSCHAVYSEAFYNTAFSTIVNLMKPVKHFRTN